MDKLLQAGVFTALLLVGALAILAFANACTPRPELEVQPAPALPDAGETLTVMTWNLGYAALGDDADFVADGGDSIRASDRGRIEANLEAITGRLRASSADVHLLQEVAGPGFMTRGIDVRGAVFGVFEGRWSASSADVRTRLLPQPIALDHGLFAASRPAVDSARTVEITREPERMAGIIARAYHVQLLRLSGPGRWSLINIHLSAFDQGDVRAQQLQDVLALAQAEYAEGRRVIIGGDFNQRLADTDFPHTTTQEDLFWLRDLPEDALPQGWMLAADPAEPTVRTLERAYAPSENYTAVIDGFILSPNVALVSVQGDDTGFAASDHQPVTVEVRAK